MSSVAPRNGTATTRLLGWMATILLTGWLGIMGWMMHSIIDLQKFAAQGDRFTVSDAVEMERRIKNEIQLHYPPRWLTERLDAMRAQLNAIVEEQKRLQIQIDRLEGHDPDSYTSDRSGKKR